MRMTKLDSYDDLSKIKIIFKSCEDVNENSHNWDKLNEANFIVLRATCDDDMHKAIKYGHWTSTHSTNQMLNELFKKC